MNATVLLLAALLCAQGNPPSNPTGGVNAPGSQGADAPATPPATGPGSSAINPGASSGSGTAPRGPQTTEPGQLGGTAVDDDEEDDDRARTQPGGVNVPGASGSSQGGPPTGTMPLPFGPSPGVTPGAPATDTQRPSDRGRPQP